MYVLEHPLKRPPNRKDEARTYVAKMLERITPPSYLLLYLGNDAKQVYVSAFTTVYWKYYGKNLMLVRQAAEKTIGSSVSVRKAKGIDDNVYNANIKKIKQTFGNNALFGFKKARSAHDMCRILEERTRLGGQSGLDILVPESKNMPREYFLRVLLYHLTFQESAPYFQVQPPDSMPARSASAKVL